MPLLLTNQINPKYGYLSIRNETGHYIRYRNGQKEFYDTTKDPHEWANEINNPKYATVIQKMRAAVPSPAEVAAPMPTALTLKKARKKRK